MRCNKNWGKIKKIMKDVELPEFSTPDNFIDLNNVVKMHAEEDALWTEEFTKIADAKPGQVRKFTEHLIRAQTMLQQLKFSLVKYRVNAVDISGIYAAPMEQHRFAWAQTCEKWFVSWIEYENSHPFQEVSQDDY
jgi:hypothetical protein